MAAEDQAHLILDTARRMTAFHPEAATPMQVAKLQRAMRTLAKFYAEEVRRNATRAWGVGDG